MCKILGVKFTLFMATLGDVNTWMQLTAEMWWESLNFFFFFCRSDENVNFLCGAGRFFVVAQALHANELWNLSLVPLQCSSTGYPAWQLGATICSDSPSPPFLPYTKQSAFCRHRAVPLWPLLRQWTWIHNLESGNSASARDKDKERMTKHALHKIKYRPLITYPLIVQDRM